VSIGFFDDGPDDLPDPDLSGIGQETDWDAELAELLSAEQAAPQPEEEAVWEDPEDGPQVGLAILTSKRWPMEVIAIESPIVPGMSVTNWAGEQVMFNTDGKTCRIGQIGEWRSYHYVALTGKPGRFAVQAMWLDTQTGCRHYFVAARDPAADDSTANLPDTVGEAVRLLLADLLDMTIEQVGYFYVNTRPETVLEPGQAGQVYVDALADVLDASMWTCLDALPMPDGMGGLILHMVYPEQPGEDE